jgi:hypothetical protein
VSIFDLKDLSDIPDELMEQLNLTSRTDRLFLDLFKEKSPLNITELLIGYFRKYGELKTRNYIMVNCYRMSKKGLIKPTKRKGEYKL